LCPATVSDGADLPCQNPPTVTLSAC
jgi:hypothetical protein